MINNHEVYNTIMITIMMNHVINHVINNMINIKTMITYSWLIYDKTSLINCMINMCDIRYDKSDDESMINTYDRKAFFTHERLA